MLATIAPQAVAQAKVVPALMPGAAVGLRVAMGPSFGEAGRRWAHPPQGTTPADVPQCVG
jgi:hypothetical protein